MTDKSNENDYEKTKRAVGFILSEDGNSILDSEILIKLINEAMIVNDAWLDNLNKKNKGLKWSVNQKN